MGQINQEQKIIDAILRKYQHEKGDEKLKKKIYDELTSARFKEEITSSFKVVLRKSNDPSIHDFVEVVLETKL